MSENLTQLDTSCLFFPRVLKTSLWFPAAGTTFFHVLLNVVLRGPTSSLFKCSKSPQIAVQPLQVFDLNSNRENSPKTCGPHSVNMLLEVYVYMCMYRIERGVITSTLNRISRMRPLNCFFLPAGQISALLLL